MAKRLQLKGQTRANTLHKQGASTCHNVADSHLIKHLGKKVVLNGL